MTDTIEIVTLTPADARRLVGALADLLIDCVEGGASVSFMAPLACEKAQAFWSGIADGVERGERLVLVARDEGSGTVVGTVHLVLGLPENQPHRADVSKMLVRRAARRRGIAAALMRAVEREALAAGRTLLVLDTAEGGDAERLYGRMGWVRVGLVPGFALWPDGRPCGTVFLYKELAAG